MVEKIMGLFFEKRKQNKKDVLSLILIFALCIVNIVGFSRIWTYFGYLALYQLQSLLLRHRYILKEKEAGKMMVKLLF
ncbi:hypothetical protein SOP93_22010 [Peribacillus frigoritolerans]|uniref:hypothetical protein n=1 Tax=Peribacillus frigoritolerans TaxID=450367 RepID=UPI002B25119D|nr:hypothetical protein [Peribacillus frigoritolerans]MEB2493810.1 hypothetical protein [Peribacillus frigoritolerans]